MRSGLYRAWIVLGAIAGLGAVAMAAVASHAGLQTLGAERVAMLHSGVEMQGWHALALIACGLWARRGGPLAHLAGAAYAAGLLLFCGAVYAVALVGSRVGTLAPVGGVLLMLGWVLLGVSALRPPERAG